MPFWDNAIHAHYAIPGQDGMACLYRLVRLPQVANLVIRRTTRASRDAKTRRWLGQPDGVWRNGWYEDGTGQRWNADMLSSWANNKFEIHVNHFDSRKGHEFNCSSPVARSDPPLECNEPLVTQQWGEHFHVTDQIVWANQVAISNGARFGLFLLEAKSGARSKPPTRWRRSFPTGIGVCISSSRTFNLLPLVLLPRLKITMAAFWTAGCEFEGQQAALAEAWAAIYPAITEFMLFYYSLLNWVAKLTRRRMSDVRFGPTVLLFCLLHHFRFVLGLSGVLGVDGRVSTVMMSDEVDALRLVDLFTTNAALRINGNIRVLFYGKLVVLTLNLVRLLVAVRPPKAMWAELDDCDIEEAIKIRSAPGVWAASDAPI